MMSWMLRLAAWATPRRGRARMDGARRTRDGREPRLGVEGLERREVLSTASVTPIFSSSGQVRSPSQAAAVDFVLSSGSLTKPRDGTTVLLGLNPRPAAGSSVTPSITKVVGPGGKLSTTTIGSMRVGAPFLTRVAVPSGRDAAYTATVTGLPGETGGVVLDGFLPGDVNGDLQVDTADLDLIRDAYGSREGDSRYTAAADINQDGRVGCRDRSYATRNFGVRATIVPPPRPPALLTPVAISTQAPPPPPPAVAPVVTPVAAAAPVTVAAPPAVAAPIVATGTANVVWIPVLTNPGGATPWSDTIGGRTWPATSSAYYPTQYGAAIPSGPVGAVSPAYYTTLTTTPPPSPYYFALPATAVAGDPAARAGSAPVFVVAPR